MARPPSAPGERRATSRATREASNLSRAQVRGGSGAIEGLDTVLANLNKEIKALGGPKSRGGMRKALLIARRESVKLTPIDTGNLRNSAFTEVEEEGGVISGIIGYTAAYAPFVHEINANYVRGQWKFLETALAENHQAILAAIAEEVKL